MKQMYLSLFMESVKINHALGFGWTENSKSMFFFLFIAKQFIHECQNTFVETIVQFIIALFKECTDRLNFKKKSLCIMSKKKVFVQTKLLSMQKRIDYYTVLHCEK